MTGPVPPAVNVNMPKLPTDKRNLENTVDTRRIGGNMLVIKNLSEIHSIVVSIPKPSIWRRNPSSSIDIIPCYEPEKLSDIIEETCIEKAVIKINFGIDCDNLKNKALWRALCVASVVFALLFIFTAIRFFTL
jgi:hypothetical protein